MTVINYSMPGEYPETAEIKVELVAKTVSVNGFDAVVIKHYVQHDMFGGVERVEVAMNDEGARFYGKRIMHFDRKEVGE